MSKYLTRLVAAVLTGIAQATADRNSERSAEAVEFSGYMLFGSETRFVLTDPSALTASGWLLIGQKFAGFTISEFLPEEETLVVDGASGRKHLHLKAGRIREPVLTQPAPPLPENRIIILEDGRLFTSDRIVEVSDLVSCLREFAADHSEQRFKLSIYRPWDGQPGMVQEAIRKIRDTLRTMPAELRSRYPFVVWQGKSFP